MNCFHRYSQQSLGRMSGSHNQNKNLNPMQATADCKIVKHGEGGENGKRADRKKQWGWVKRQECDRNGGECKSRRTPKWFGEVGWEEMQWKRGERERREGRE